jgi:energy-coupling factor transport system permease protein
VLLVSGVGWRRLGDLWRALAWLLILVIVLWPLFDQEGAVPLIEVGGLRITLESMRRGVVAATRLAAISFLVYAWLATTSERAMVRALVRLGMPYRWGVALTLGLRAIPTLAGLYAAVVEAQESRGLRLTGSLQVRLRHQVPILVSTLVAALRLADQMSRVLDSRALGAARPTAHAELRMSVGDWLAFAAVVAFATAVVLAHIPRS